MSKKKKSINEVVAEIKQVEVISTHDSKMQEKEIDKAIKTVAAEHPMSAQTTNISVGGAVERANQLRFKNLNTLERGVMCAVLKLSMAELERNIARPIHEQLTARIAMYFDHAAES